MHLQNHSKAREISRITQDMHDFHQEAWNQLDRLEANAGKLKKGAAAERAAALKEIAEVANFIESGMWSHFKQEEDEVYTALKKALPPGRRRSVTVMEKDHKTMGALVKEVKESMVQARSAAGASADQGRQTADACLRLVTVMRKHITKEDLLYQELGEAP